MPIFNLKIINLNVNGCGTNLDTFLCDLDASDTTFDILVLTETKLCDDTDSTHDIVGYNHFSVHRNCHGGGIRLYFRDTFNVKLIDEFSDIFETHESLFAKVQLPGFGSFILGCFYRPPRLSLCNFNSFLENVLFCNQSILTSKCIFSGDFNINLANNIVPNYQTKNFCNILKENNFNQLVYNLTRCDYQTGQPISLLDHIWCNFEGDYRADVLESAPSDHLPILFTLKLKTGYTTTLMKFRNFSQQNIERFSDNLDNIFDNYKINFNNNANSEFSRFVEFLNNTLNSYFPKVTKNISLKRLSMPWVDKEVLSLINKKHKLFILLKRGRVTYAYFNAYCKLLNIVLQRLKKNYYNVQFNKYKRNPLKTWNLINILYGRGKKQTVKTIKLPNGSTTVDAKTISTVFNEYFTTVAEKLQSNLGPSLHNYDYLVPCNIRSIYLSSTTSNELNGIIKSLDSSKGAEFIPIKFLKMCISNLCPVLCQLINYCMLTGVYPDCLKVARIIPIYKKGDKELLGNYRPISILPSLNKIFEKVIYSRLVNFISHCNILSENQFGFVKLRDTQQAALKLITGVLPSFLSNEYAAGLFLDFSRAFDTLDRERGFFLRLIVMELEDLCIPC